MPWIKNIATNPGAGAILVRFRVFTTSTPHTGLVGVTGVYVSSTATVRIWARRRNADETQTYDGIFQIICPADNSILIRSHDDPIIPMIGLPEAGNYEICDFYNVSAVTGTVFIAVEVFGGPVDVLIGGAF